ncbi:hypothetical protein P9112_003129 [Eukaryota sp. TZLM1-RC]
MQQQRNTQQQHTTNIQKVDETTDPVPTSPFKKEKVEREDEVPPAATLVAKGTGAGPSPTSFFKVTKEVTRTDSVLSPLKEIVSSSEVTRTDSVLSPLPNVGSSKETDGNPTLHNQPL